jgi:tRNA pseudouridine38-40 synthase
MIKYLGVCEYVGRRYKGWQYQGQSETESVQGVLHKTITHIYHRKLELGYVDTIHLVGSSRTDKGVHALANTFHMEFVAKQAEQILDPSTLLKRVNFMLSKEGHEIKLIHVQQVPIDFHARYSAKERTYFYKLFLGKESVFLKDFYWCVGDLDIEKLKQASKMFIGKFHITNFCREFKGERTVSSLDILEHNSAVILQYVARSFRWHQVRFMTGAMVDYATDRITLEKLESYFDPAINTKPRLAPSEGLYLAKICY